MGLETMSSIGGEKMVTKGRFRVLTLGVRMKNLAKEVDVSESYLTNIINGRVKPSPAVLKRIAEALGLRPEEIQEEARIEG
jgi:transcriptional regulator with XRE-family HTH domain